jgi:hypothetical protein
LLLLPVRLVAFHQQSVAGGRQGEPTRLLRRRSYIWRDVSNACAPAPVERRAASANRHRLDGKRFFFLGKLNVISRNLSVMVANLSEVHHV